jgi:4-hydroxybutyrate CoA-transferase
MAVDLTGQVNSESIGPIQYGGQGGQMDFVRGTGMSEGGKAFLCLRSTFTDKEGNEKSTITGSLPPYSTVTVPRADVQYIVTEYGIADLRFKTIKERVEAMVSIAHPDFREQLMKEAVDKKLFY